MTSTVTLTDGTVIEFDEATTLRIREARGQMVATIETILRERGLTAAEGPRRCCTNNVRFPSSWTTYDPIMSRADPHHTPREHTIAIVDDDGMIGCRTCDPAPCPVMRALHGAYTALNAIKRAGFPMDEDWPTVADEAFEDVGTVLYPSA